MQCILLTLLNISSLLSSIEKLGLGRLLVDNAAFGLELKLIVNSYFRLKNEINQLLSKLFFSLGLRLSSVSLLLPFSSFLKSELKVGGGGVGGHRPGRKSSEESEPGSGQKTFPDFYVFLSRCLAGVSASECASVQVCVSKCVCECVCVYGVRELVNESV